MKRKAKIDKNVALYNCQYQASLKAVNAYFNDLEKAALWMNMQNPLLGNVTPISMLKVGRFDKLQKFIYDQIGDDKV
jgi:Protein of unknown function (DUF2384).